MTERPQLQALFAEYTGSLLDGTAKAIEDLTIDELHFRPNDDCNSIGFDAWHIARTVDNMVRFVFERQPPIWLEQQLDERWSLPKVAQGTGMPAEDAHALRFPAPEQLAAYAMAVREAVVPRIATMSDDEIALPVQVRPHGELTRAESITRVILTHGNNHLGMISLARTLLGKPGLGF